MSSGRFRIFLGMCPGVGKTYAMLLAAQQRQENGEDVAVGALETHGRIETIALSAGLRRIPPRSIEHRGVVVEEMDLDAVVARRPGLVLVDELAHTNAPGSRHPKRYQDMLEVLAAGIDVYTTLNVQHLESLRDAVARITGVMVREAVPDSVIDRADEVELVDVTPAELRQRLDDGKVYLGDRAARAGEAFFREGNLKALREMALRIVAERADRDVRRHLKDHAISGPWRSRERLLVAVGPSPHAERLIRIARRLADSLDATWIAAHADTGAPADEAGRDRLAANLSLARSLGAEVVSTDGGDAAEALIALARRENVTQIIAGKTPDRAPWNRPLSERLVRASGEIDVLLVHPGESTARPPPPRVPSGWLRDVCLAAALLAAGSVAGLLAEPLVGYRSVTMFYLLLVAVSGLFLHRRAVVGLAVASAVAWNYLFTEPRFTLSMWKGEDVVLLATFTIVAAIVGQQTARLRRRERSSREGETRARALYELTRAMSEESELAPALARALRQIEAMAEAEASVLQRDGGDGVRVIAGASLTTKEHSVCEWAARHAEAAGRFTGTLPETGVLALPLRVGERVHGVLAVRPRTTLLASPLQRDLLDAFAAHIAVLIERDEADRARRRAASHDLQRALLDNVSHELKTPVAVIRAGVERLRVAPDTPVLDEMEAAAARLDRVTGQLVALSRVESGLVEPHPEVCDAGDLLREVCAEFKNARLSVQAPAALNFRADAGLLHVALSNLVRNALEHSDASVELAAAAAGGSVELTVADRGPGVSPEAFSRFWRGASAKPGGLGLGLSIARHFVEAQGGSVEARMRAGGGSIIAVRLPAAEVPS